MTLAVQLILFFVAVVIGGLLLELIKKGSNIKLLLSFSGGFLLTIIFTHILPESYEMNPNTGFFILIGFMLQLVLEYFSKGAEHGHTHIHEHAIVARFPIAIFLSLCLHSFIEAIPLNQAHIHDEHIQNSYGLYWGVFVHKIPVAIALKTILDASGLSKQKSWMYLLIFGLTGSFGLLMGDWVMTYSSFSLTWLLAMAIGMFFHVSTTIIFESSEGHKINLFKLTAIIIGFAVGLLIG